MHYRRVWIITLAIILSILSTTLPLFAAYYYSWERATQLEQQRLTEVTTKVVERVRQTYQEAKSILIQLNQQQFAHCSPEQIAMIKNLTFHSRVTEEIGYLQDGQQICDSRGKHAPKLFKFTDEITTDDGIRITLNFPSPYKPDKRMISLRSGDYHVIINPDDFSNIILTSDAQLALFAHNGVLIASLNHPDLESYRNYLFEKIKKPQSNYIFTTATNKNFVAIASENKSYFYTTLSKLQCILIPLGLLLTLPLIVMIIRFSKHQLSIVSELAYAIDRNQLTIMYQPIMDLQSKKCIGAEALIRWFISEKESISPDYFITVAEKAGLLPKITRFVINTVIQDMKAALSTNPDMHISINFSANDFQNLEIINIIDALLKDTAIQRNQIWLEITERQLVQFEKITPVLEQIRAMNYKFAMDDFGTGYSNLSYLNNIPLDVLKIDKSFIDTIDMNTVTSHITEHVIMLAKGLNLSIVAEGIETIEQCDYLRKRDVEYGQGWLFSKALRREEFLEYYSTHNIKIK